LFLIFKALRRLVVGSGNILGKLVVVGEAPGAQEDMEGKPFVGKSGKYLKNLLEISGINISKDVYFCNVIKCRPPNNRKPTQKEISIHKPWLIQQIKLVNPRIVILAGSTAMKTLLEKSKTISLSRGKWFNYGGIEYIPIFHPSYLMRFPQNEVNNPYGLTLKDLKNVRNRLYNL
tara:strand:+ start:984 stop:1508 length:525 start_codon:yes stop_codon:yes gene_type:complete